MKNLLRSLIIIIHICGVTEPAGVTYTFSGGRFGDQLISYLHARWVAYKYKIPFVYVPFDYSDKLRVHKIHHETSASYTNTIVFPTKGAKVKLDSLIDPNLDVLYVIPFFPESEDQKNRLGYWNFDIDWSDKKFREILRKELSPIIALSKLNLPKDRKTVALHMRRGGGFDSLLQDQPVRLPNARYDDMRIPLKFAPLEFYLDQLVKLSDSLGNPPLYAHIFTDDKNPKALLEKCSAILNKPNIALGTCDAESCPGSGVLDDFFSLTQFDILIRADSNFSLVAAKLANYEMEIYPIDSRWEGTKLIITDVAIIKK